MAISFIPHTPFQQFFSAIPRTVSPHSVYTSGGCTVTLVKREAAGTLMTTLREEYLAKTGNTCDCFVTKPCDGAGVIVPLR